jgi:hypothetical protein
MFRARDEVLSAINKYKQYVAIKVLFTDVSFRLFQVSVLQLVRRLL